jgi:hypothetical protein
MLRESRLTCCSVEAYWNREDCMSALTIRRIGWAGYVVTTEAGTRIVVDPYLHGSENPTISAVTRWLGCSVC